MRKIGTTLFFLGALGTLTGGALLTGCGNSSAGSCAQSSGGAVISCTDYGDGYTAAQVMGSCSGASSTYASSACPSDSRVARCVISVAAGGVTASATVSYYPPLTIAAVMQACSQANVGGGITATFTAN